MALHTRVLLAGLLGLCLSVVAAWLGWPASIEAEPAAVQPVASQVGVGPASPLTPAAAAAMEDSGDVAGAAAMAASAESGLLRPADLARAKPPQALKLLKRCYFADSCQFGDDAALQGLDRHFKLSLAIAAQLRALPGQASEFEQAELAREFLGFPDGHVQAEALSMAARLPPDPSTVNAAVAALADSYDAVLFKQAFPVLQQWQSQGMRSGYDEMLLGIVHTGGWHAAQAVAENLTPFLNEANVARFEAIAAQLAPGARQDALRLALRDYRLLRGGG